MVERSHSHFGLFSFLRSVLSWQHTSLIILLVCFMLVLVCYWSLTPPQTLCHLTAPDSVQQRVPEETSSHGLLAGGKDPSLLFCFAGRRGAIASCQTGLQGSIGLCTRVWAYLGHCQNNAEGGNLAITCYAECFV